jgi:hypothetical protein
VSGEEDTRIFRRNLSLAIPGETSDTVFVTAASCGVKIEKCAAGRWKVILLLVTITLGVSGLLFVYTENNRSRDYNKNELRDAVIVIHGEKVNRLEVIVENQGTSIREIKDSQLRMENKMDVVIRERIKADALH